MNGRDSINAECFDRSASSKADRNIDLWLRDSLACTYNDVLSEKLPASWLALIDKAGHGV